MPTQHEHNTRGTTLSQNLQRWICKSGSCSVVRWTTEHEPDPPAHPIGSFDDQFINIDRAYPLIGKLFQTVYLNFDTSKQIKMITANQAHVQ